MRYWEERAREWQKARDKKSAKLTADLVRAYRKAAEELQKEIFAWYEKYATAEGVTLADAKKALSTDELKKLKRDLETFEKLAKENGKHTHDKVLTKMSAAVHVSRLESLQLQMRCILYELYKNVDDELTDTLKSFYADERERMAYETQLARGEFEQIAMTDEKRIERVLKTPWATDGKDFSSRLWTNREQLVGTLQAEITRALITGDDSASVGKAIAKKLNASLYAASRVAQTEITRVTTESDKDTFAEMDVEEVEVVGTLDLKTCGTCGDMDSKHMPRAEAHAGTTAPPFHPNCRCVIVPYFADEEAIGRAMRDPVTGKTKIDAAMSFKEWKERYGSGNTVAVKEYGGHTQYGAYNNKNDPTWEKRDEHAALYYREIRQNGRETFVRKISKNTGLSRRFIEKVYDHVFVNKHRLDSGYGFLAESYYMAVAFQRLLQGEQTDDDVLLLYHERLEWALENRYNMIQREAHENANKKHNFEITIKPEGDETE